MRSLGRSQKKACTDSPTTQAAGSYVLTADIAQMLSGRGSNSRVITLLLAGPDCVAVPLEPCAGSVWEEIVQTKSSC